MQTYCDPRMKNTICVRNLTKTYRLYRSKADRAAEVFLPFGKPRHTEHHALHNISFEIQEGESVGIIGRNGSGKSTLLKVLTGVLAPTHGEVQVHGKVASLLELGAGFNPELTGRENIYFNGTLMGCSRTEIEQRLDEIIAFADIGEFIDQPVKVYSSGMFVRLAFAVSVHVNPDVLIVDEALAVGDVRFQKKCIDFMRRFKDSGKTILFVSHDIFTVKSFCNRLILIHDGQIEAIGDPDEVANRYHQIMFPKSADVLTHAVSTGSHLDLLDAGENGGYWLEIDASSAGQQWGDGAVWIKKLRIGGLREPNLFGWQSELEFEAVLQWEPTAIARICNEHNLYSGLIIGFRFENKDGWVITTFTNATLDADAFDIDLMSSSSCIIRLKVAKMKLAAGHYFISPGLAIGTKISNFPVKEYTNLIHLFCDTKNLVWGQMVLEHEIVLVASN